MPFRTWILTYVLKTAHIYASLILLVLGAVKLNELLRTLGWGEFAVLLSIGAFVFVGIFLVAPGEAMEPEKYQLLRRERDETRYRVRRYEETLREIVSEAAADANHVADCGVAGVAQAALAGERDVLAVAEDHEESSHWKWCARCEKALPTFTEILWSGTAPRAIRTGESEGGPWRYHCSVCQASVEDWTDQGTRRAVIARRVFKALLGIAVLWWLLQGIR